jgi:hypothetical protein
MNFKGLKRRGESEKLYPPLAMFEGHQQKWVRWTTAVKKSFAREFERFSRSTDRRAKPLLQRNVRSIRSTTQNNRSALPVRTS